MALLPRRAIRLLRYILVASAVLAFCYSRNCHPLSPSSSSNNTPSRPSRRADGVDFAWGSILHRFQNHPRPARKRSELPWAGERAGRAAGGNGERGRTRVLIVTSELAGLHKNGGIGTAFLELAHALAGDEGEDAVEMSILVAHMEETFAASKVERLREDLASKRISLLFVSPEPQPFYPQAWTPTASMRVWRFLRAQDGAYDIVHFPDNTGIGYFSALGRYAGLALLDTRLVVGLHGADAEWAAMLNKRYPSDKYAIELAEFERKTAEMADAVVAPSEYMLEYARTTGWALPETALVIPNVVQVGGDAKQQEEKAQVVQPVDELVFFGRLEERKGTRLLVQTLEALFSAPNVSSALSGIRTVTFLGRDQADPHLRTDASVLIGNAISSINEHTNATLTTQFLKTLDRDEALAYLSSPSRLALLPSLADNSPSTVLECIAHNIRFIASSVGGVPELVHPQDRDAVLFPPLVRAFGEKLIATLEHLASEPWTPPRAAAETQNAVQDWRAFHRWLAARAPSVPALAPTTAKKEDAEPLVSICITHFERAHLLPQLLDSLLAQDYTNFEVVVVDDGSSSSSVLSALSELERQYFSPSSPPSSFSPSYHPPELNGNRTLPPSLFHSPRHPWRLIRTDNAYLGEARNRAASYTSPRSAFLLFLDDDDVLKPHALRTLVNVARRTGAQALSTWLDEFASDVNPLAPRALVPVRGGDVGEVAEEELPHRRSYWFLGSSLAAGLLSNSFGSGNVFVSRPAWERSGGFSTYREVGAEDWEFWGRLAIKGERMTSVPEELVFVRSDPARESMKFSMDPWDAHFHAAVPLLNDDRIQELGLAHTLMLLKGVVTKKATVRPFADSREDFQLVQGWSGWHYSFEAIERADGVNGTAEGWAPSLRPEALGYPDSETQTFAMDRNHPRKPFVDDSFQEGWVGPDGKPVVAVRTFRSPRRMDVAIDLSARANHQCGDGTEVSLLAVGGPGEEPEVLVRWSTLDEAFSEFSGDISLRPGSMLHLVSHPLENDDCDRVEVRLQLTQVSLDNKRWSSLTKKAAIQAAQVRKATAQQTKVKAKSWAKVETAGPKEDDVFNVALIFDRNRFAHAKSVIRSAQQFLTSPRKLVFHLIAPKELHLDTQEFFAGEEMTLRLYDYELCRYAVRQVLPFSDSDIHTSAHCKVFLPEIITFAERVLYLDTDVTVVSDLARCYARPTRNPAALISMAVDMGDACQRTPDACWPIGLHWRVPSGLGLDCGNVPARAAAPGSKPPASCAEEDELETLQVNGGVALLELKKMKDQGFIERYVQSVVHHYRLMGGKRATWGEQDFINSYFRLFPGDLELLPCGCNYQWFGARREVKCGEQEVSIAHHWSHGIARRTSDPYNTLFFHFVDNVAGAALPPIPSLSPSLPGAPNSSDIALEHSLNCPRQSHDCTATFAGTEHGQPVLVLSRVLAETFAADLTDMLEAQTYPKISHAVALRESVDLPELSFQQDRLGLPADPAEEYALLCERCGSLAAEGQSCSTPPADEALRKRYYDCVCALEDGNAGVMFDLEALAASSEEGWILYLDDTQTLVSAEALSLLMAQVDSPDELILFRSNTTTSVQDALFRKKILPRSSLDGVGFLFHSSHLDHTAWSSSTRCGRSATLNRLASHLRLRWIDFVPTMEHPLQRHLPHTPPEDFLLSIVVLETQERVSWTALLLEKLQEPELMPLVKEVVVASVDTEDGAYGLDVKVVNPTVGSGLAELASAVGGEHVLLLSDSILLEKPALTALVTHHLDAPSRLVGLFTETDQTGDFSLPLPLSEDEGFDVFTEPDALVGLPTWTHLLPRTLLTSRSLLEELSTTLSSSATSEREPLHPVCHPVLLSALSRRASTGQSPLRILPPAKSLVDRVYDCRIRNIPEIAYGSTAGDWAVPTPSLHDDEDDGELEFDEEGFEIVKTPKAPEYDEAEFPVPPSLDDCLASVAELLGEGAEQWLVPGEEVGVTGPLGVKVGVEQASDISEERWHAARRMEKCYQT